MIVVDANISVKLPPAYLLVCSWLIKPCKCCHNIYRSYLGATSSSSSYQSSNCVDKIFCLCFAGIDETVEMVRAEGGTCIGYRVDISKKEEVYKAADVIRAEMGDVSKNHACASNCKWWSSSSSRHFFGSWIRKYEYQQFPWNCGRIP